MWPRTVAVSNLWDYILSSTGPKRYTSRNAETTWLSLMKSYGTLPPLPPPTPAVLQLQYSTTMTTTTVSDVSSILLVAGCCRLDAGRTIAGHRSAGLPPCNEELPQQQRR